MENSRKNSAAKIAANNRYKNAHYKRLVADIKPADFEFIDNYAKEHDISKAQLIVKAIRYVADNDIDLKDDKE